MRHDTHEDSYTGRTALVVGAARSGIAATRFLLSRGARVILSDSRSADALRMGVDPLRQRSRPGGELVLELGGHQAESFRNCDFVVLSPGVPLTVPQLEETRKRGIPILAEVELAYRHLKGKILGITGTNGKSTTTTLVAEILRGAGLSAYAAGNLGIPLISFVERSKPEDVYAVELSSFQLETIHEFRPSVAVILNATPNHLDRYRTFEDYVAAKQRIFMNQAPCDFAVLNADNSRTAAMANQVPSSTAFFSRLTEVSRGGFLRGDRIMYRDGLNEHEILTTNDIALRGRHNLENVIAAVVISALGGAALQTMRDVVRKFRGIEHRLEWVAEIDGVDYFNDSKATSVDATLKSLESFPGPIRVILGGRDKEGNFALLRPLVTERVKQVILIGEAAGKIRAALEGTVEMVDVSSMDEAVEEGRRKAQAGDVVLLAPACASFDMFDDFEHRGRVFKRVVLGLRGQS